VIYSHVRVVVSLLELETACGRFGFFILNNGLKMDRFINKKYNEYEDRE